MDSLFRTVHVCRLIEHGAARPIGAHGKRTIRATIARAPQAVHLAQRTVLRLRAAEAASASPAEITIPVALAEELVLSIRANAAHAGLAAEDRQRDHGPQYGDRES